MRTVLIPTTTILPLIVITMMSATQALAAPPQIDLLKSERAQMADESISPAAVLQPLARPDENSADGFVLCLDTMFQFATTGGTDCWGWQDPDDGQEYAIMGVSTGIVFVNTTTRQVVTTVTGPQTGCGNTRWRDMKNYGHYLYAVSECTGTNNGLMIINMQNLPASVQFVKSYNLAGQTTCHNLSIDTAKGYAYLVRAGYDGFRVLNLASPENPVELPFVATPDMHDIFAINDTVWAAEGNSHTWSVWNMANKNAPQLIVRVTVPAGGYVHNIWPSADRHFAATTEETVSKTIKIWDISNYANVQLVGSYLAPSGLAHNAHFNNGRYYMSHYESGVAVIGITNPAVPNEVARFDTYATESGNFNGCWGVWPHSATGRVYASNLDGRLYIFRGFDTNTSNDTLKGSTIVTAPATKISIDVTINNDYPISEIILPIDWAGPYNMLWDSISVAGLRSSGFYRVILAEDLMNSRSVWDLSGAPIPAGSGPVAKIFFRVPGAATGDSNLVKIDQAFLTPVRVSNNCFEFNPITKFGVVKLPTTSPCCVNRTGNCDGDLLDAVDIGDLTALIDHLFISFAPLACEGEGNVSGDLAGSVDIADLTALIDHLFISFAQTADCL